MQSQHFLVPDLSSNIVAFDLGRLFASAGNGTRLRQNMLFVSTSIESATTDDHRISREIHGVKTVVNTGYLKTRRYIKDGATFKTDDYQIENVLGLQLCRINLRNETFIRSVIHNLPTRTRLKFEADANAAQAKNRYDPDLLKFASELCWNQDSIDEGYIILVASASVNGRLFNELLSDETRYPLLICGDIILRDNALLIFVLLLLLEIPIADIETTYMRMTEQLLSNIEQLSLVNADVVAAWANNRPRWTRALVQRLETKYGSVSAYLWAAGITEQTKSRIKSVFLVTENEDLIDIS